MNPAASPGVRLPVPGDAAVAGVPADPDPPKAPLSLAQRVLEVLPGLATWSVIISLVVLPTLVYPVVVVSAVVVLDLYWLVRSVIVTRGIRRTFHALRRDMAIDWYQRCLALPVASWTDADGAAYDPREIYHAALIPTYTERYEVLQATLKAWDEAAYPGERKIVAIITRTTDIDGIENVRRLQQEFAGRFAHF